MVSMSTFMRRTLALTAIAGLGLALPALAQNAAPAQNASPAGPANPSEAANANVTNAEQFVAMAAASGEFEIQSSRLALEKSQTDSVRTFAQRMIDDHTAASQQLMSVATAQNVAMPNPPTPTPTQQQQLDALSSNAADFDTAYTRAQIDAHDAAIALFTSFATNGDNDALKQFAVDTLPKLQEHRAMLPAEAQR